MAVCGVCGKYLTVEDHGVAIGGTPACRGCRAEFDAAEPVVERRKEERVPGYWGLLVVGWILRVAGLVMFIVWIGWWVWAVMFAPMYPPNAIMDATTFVYVLLIPLTVMGAGLVIGALRDIARNSFVQRHCLMAIAGKG